MKKLLGIVVLGLLLSGNAYSKIIFWAVCENPKGVRYSESILHLDNDKIKSSIHYLNMALRMLGHTFTEDEDIENSTFIDNE